MVFQDNTISVARPARTNETSSKPASASHASQMIILRYAFVRVNSPVSWQNPESNQRTRKRC